MSLPLSRPWFVGLAVLCVLPGCFVTTLSRSIAMGRAAAVPTTGLSRAVSTVAGDGTRYTLTVADADATCVEIDAPIDPGQMMATRFELRGVAGARDPMRRAPVARDPAVRLLATSSHDVAYDRIVHDQVKNSDGKVVATTDRVVQDWTTVHQSAIELCFGAPPLDEDSAYLVVRALVPPVIVGLGLPGAAPWAPRPGWFHLVDADNATTDADVVAVSR